MANVGGIYTTISLQTSDFERRIQGVVSTVERATNRINSAASKITNVSQTLSRVAFTVKRVGDEFQSAGRTLSSAVTLPLLAVGGASIKLAADLETAQIAFETMLGSAEKAGAFVKELAQFAATTPFEFQGLQNTSRLLISFGFEVEKVIPILRTLGDATAALGGGQAELQGIARAIGQIQTKGRVQAEELLQLAERGVPAYEILKEELNLTGEEVANIGRKGISAERAIDALLTGLDKRFKGATENLSQTTTGLFSTLRDSVKFALADIGQEIIRVFDLKTKLKNAIETVQTLAARFKALDDNVKKTIITVGAIATAIGPALIAFGTFTNVVGVALNGLRLLTGALPAIASAFTALSGPVGLAVAAIAATAALIVANWDDVVDYFQNGRGAETYQNLVETTERIVKRISSSWKAFSDVLKRTFAGMDEIVDGALITIIGIVETGANLIINSLDLITAFLNFDWKQAWGAATSIVEDFVKDSTNLLQQLSDKAPKLTANVLKALLTVTGNKALADAIDRQLDIIEKRIEQTKNKIDPNALIGPLDSQLPEQMAQLFKDLKNIEGQAKKTNDVLKDAPVGPLRAIENELEKINERLLDASEDQLPALLDRIRELEKEAKRLKELFVFDFSPVKEVKSLGFDVESQDFEKDGSLKKKNLSKKESLPSEGRVRPVEISTNLSSELVKIDKLAALLGNTFDATRAKIVAVENAIIDLIDAGKDLNDPAIQAYKKLLDSLNSPIQKFKDNLLDIGTNLQEAFTSTGLFDNVRAELEITREEIAATEDEMRKLGSQIAGGKSSDAEKERFKELQSRLRGLKGIADHLSSPFERAKVAIESFAKAALNSIRQTIKALIAEGITAAVANAFKNPLGVIPPVGLALAAAAGAGAAILFDSIIPKFAKGGEIPSGFPNDSFVGKLTSGEVVIPKLDLNKLLRNAINFGGSLSAASVGQTASASNGTVNQGVFSNTTITHRVEFGTPRWDGRDLLFTIEELQRREGRQY